MSLTLWVIIDDAERLYEDLELTKKNLGMKEYGYSVGVDKEIKTGVPILTGVLDQTGYLGRAMGDFELVDGLWTSKIRGRSGKAGHFVVARKGRLKSLYDINSKERYESGTHFLFGNHPVYGPSGMYFTTRDAVASMDIESLTRPGERTRTLEDITGKHRIELAGSTDDDLIYRAFLTYHMSGYMVRFDPGTNKPPLLVYEKNPVRHAA